MLVFCKYVVNYIIMVKKRNRSSTEDALIQAAKQLFALKGYEQTRTHEIAKKAEVNEALITRYFGGKEGLLIAALRQTEGVAWIPSAKQGDSLKGFLQKFFKAGAKYILLKQDFIRITFSRALIDPSMAQLLRDQFIEQSFQELIDQLKIILGSKVKESELKALVVLLLANNFSMNFMGKVVHRLESKKIEQITIVLVDALTGHFKTTSKTKKR